MRNSMKKLLLILFACFFMASFAVADSNYTSENAVILGPNMGGEGITPPVEIIKVTVGSEDNVTIGKVMTWNIDQSTDGEGLGFMVDICDRTMSESVGVTAKGDGPYAGVMVTTASFDVGSTNAGGAGGLTFDVTDVRGSNDAIGYMAIRGYVDADMDVSRSTQGDVLVIIGGFAGFEGEFGTSLNITSINPGGFNALSTDIGILLEAAGSADGLRKVWLR